MRRKTARYAMAVAALAAASATLASCLSERGDSMVGPVADCSLPLDNTVVGTTTTIVQIVNFTFVPEEVTIAPGTSVTWIYCEPPGEELHNTASDDGLWTSQLLDREESFTLQFDDVGEFPYHCDPHPFMQAKVIVE